MNNNAKWVLGCGCGAMLLIFGIGLIAAVFWVPRAVEWGEQQFAAEQDRRAAADNWRAPPPDASAETVFPTKAGSYVLKSFDDDATIPEFRIDLSGRHAVYEAGSSRIDVYLYSVDLHEKETLFQNVKDVYESHNGGFKRITNMEYRCYYASTRHGQNHLYSGDGWVLVFRTQDTEDREPFVLSFLETTDGAVPVVESESTAEAVPPTEASPTPESSLDARDAP